MTTTEQPPLYSERVQRWIKFSRLVRNLIMIAFGLALIGIGLVYSFVTAWSYSWIVGIVLVAGYGFGAIWQFRPYDREWSAGKRLLLSIIALAAGLVFFVQAAPSLNLIGMHAPGTITHCETQDVIHRGNVTTCYANVHWPDGTTSAGQATGAFPVGSTHTFVMPPAYARLLADQGVAQHWPDAVAFAGISTAVIVQAIWSLLLLVFNVFHGSPTKRRKIAAALPPGQLPV